MTVHGRLSSSLELKGLVEIEFSPSPPSLFPPCKDLDTPYKDPSPYIVVIPSSHLATLAFSLCHKSRDPRLFPRRIRANN